MEQNSTTRAQKVLPGVSEVVAEGDTGAERCESSGLDVLRGIVFSSGIAPNGECANNGQGFVEEHGTCDHAIARDKGQNHDQSGSWFNSEPDHGFLHHPWDGLRLHTVMVAKMGVGAHRTR